LTGYHLTKGAPGEHPSELRRQLRDTQRLLRATRRDLREARRGQQKTRLQLRETRRESREVGRPLRAQRREGVPGDVDAAAKEIIEAVRPFTMTNTEKLYGLIQATRYIVRNKIPGDIVECGVWRGGSMQAAARTLLEAGDTSRELYLFDTFEGMTEPTEFDVRRDGSSAAELMETRNKSTWLWAIASLDDVQAGFENVDYPKDKLHYVVGKVEETIPGELPEQISILRLDTDWYESTKHELEQAYSRLSPGGILIIDDYGHWAGSKKATDDYVSALSEPLLLHRLGQGRIAVKPFPQDR
jgi:hypothetical protein